LRAFGALIRQIDLYADPILRWRLSPNARRRRREPKVWPTQKCCETRTQKEDDNGKYTDEMIEETVCRVLRQLAVRGIREIVTSLD